MRNFSKVFCSAIIIALFSQAAYSQVVISTNGSATADPSAILDIQSTEMGFLAPRMTAAEIALITTPAHGLMVYQLDGTPGYYYNTGTTFVPVWNRITDDTTPIGYWTESGGNIYYSLGNVGIGSASPAVPLDVVGAARITGSLQLDNGATNNYVLVSDASGNATWQDVNPLITNDGDWNVSTDTVYTDPSIYVGIGVSDPQAKLDVEGTARISGALLFENGATDGYVLTSDVLGNATWQAATSGADGDWTIDGNDMYSAVSGNVGIGSTTPVAKLDVAGEGHFLDSLYVTGRPGRIFINGETNHEPTLRFAYEGSSVFKQRYRLGSTPLLDPYLMISSSTFDDILWGVSNFGRVYHDYQGSGMAYMMYSAGDDPALYINEYGADPMARGINVSLSNASNSASGIASFNSGTGSAMYAGNTNQGTYAHIATLTSGVYGQFSNNNFGILGSSVGGAYGEHGSTSNRGYIGTSTEGVYGINDGLGYWGAIALDGTSNWAIYGDDGDGSNPNYGGIATDLHGASGYNGNGNWGAFGSSSYGVYGEHDDGPWGAVGTTNYGAYGVNATGRYGALGTTTEGVFGIHEDDHYGSLGTETAGVVGTLFRDGSQPLSDGDYAVKGNGVTDNDDDGTGYAYGDNVGAVLGYNEDGSEYSFGVSGYTEDANDNRSGGVFGSDHSGNNWGALAYRASTGTMYGGYFTTMDSSSTEKFSSDAKINIGISAMGDLMGAHINGDVYGLYAEGSNYSIYASGDMYRTGADVHLQQNNNGENTVMYTQVSTEMTVQTYGIGSMQGGKSSIVFDQAFSDVVSSGEPIIVTITPIGETKGVFLQNVDGNGFAVSENNNGKSNVQFSWIAIGKRKGYENISLPQDVIDGDYTQKVKRGLSNDNDQGRTGEGLYYENGTLHNGQIRPVGTDRTSEFRANVALEPAVRSERVVREAKDDVITREEVQDAAEPKNDIQDSKNDIQRSGNEIKDSKIK